MHAAPPLPLPDLTRLPHPLETLAHTGCWFCPACQRRQPGPVEDHTGSGQFCPACHAPLQWFKPWLSNAESGMRSAEVTDS
jgi:hypothetical protein